MPILGTIASSYMALSTRGIFAGGGTGSEDVNTMDYITVETTGNATDFGDMSYPTASGGAAGSSTRGVLGGFNRGYVNGTDTQVQYEYVTFATTGNVTSFGNMHSSKTELAACGNSTRGLWGLGYKGGAVLSTVEYITIATTGNGTNFGNLTQTRYQPGACASSTRAVWAAGNRDNSGTGQTSTIDYVTIATTGSGTNFGNLTYSIWGAANGHCSSSIRGIYAHGYTGTGGGYISTINYITIATTGNGTNFGNLSASKKSGMSLSSSVRGVFGGGHLNPGVSNAIEYITIASEGNATNFGDLSVTRFAGAGMSNGHGGL